MIYKRTKGLSCWWLNDSDFGREAVCVQAHGREEARERGIALGLSADDIKRMYSLDETWLEKQHWETDWRLLKLTSQSVVQLNLDDGRTIYCAL